MTVCSLTIVNSLREYPRIPEQLSPEIRHIFTHEKCNAPELMDSVFHKRLLFVFLFRQKLQEQALRLTGLIRPFSLVKNMY